MGVGQERARRQTTTTDSEWRERLRKERVGLEEGGRDNFRAIFRITLPRFCATARNDAVMGAHFGRADQEPKIDPRRVTRLFERTAVDEGGEDFYMVQSADLLVSPRGD
jgi:hypothetical protein